MCLILFCYDCHPIYRLVLAANRDEFLERPSAPLGYTYPGEDILAGRDLRSGGTWLGVTGSGRMAAITNFRDPASIRADAPSRGDIVLGFLRSTTSAAAHIDERMAGWGAYNGFNLLLSDGDQLWYCSNVDGRSERLEPGLYGLSNRFLDSPWPKVRRGKALLAQGIADGCDSDRLFAILEDRHQPEDAELPDTGVGLTWERLLAPMLIHSPVYGTRSSAVLLLGRDGGGCFSERQWRHGVQAVAGERRDFALAGR